MDFTLTLAQDERSFVEACINNERWAQKRLYEEYYSSMMSVCMRYANSEYDAIDIMHEGFIKVYKYIATYDIGTSLGAWMRRIMVNTAIDYYRKSVKRRTEDIETAYELKSYDADAISKCSEKDILEAIQNLSQSYRTVFNLYVVEGYSHKEIGEQLNISESTSRSNLVKARLKLQEHLTPKIKHTHG